MKKQIAIAALTFGAIVLGTNNVQAQKTSAETTTEVDLVLKDVLLIESGATDANVKFQYLEAAHYKADQSKEVKKGLIISSSYSFDVDVKAGTEYFTGPEGTIPVGVLDIIATGGNKGGALKFETVTLSDGNQPLVQGAGKGLDQSFDIMYKISAENAAKELLGKTAGNYNQTVTYTVTQK